LEESGHEVAVRSIENLKKQENHNYDSLIVGFPVYACTVPIIMKEFLIDLPLTTMKTAYIFCTKAFYSGDALDDAADLLSSSGTVCWDKPTSRSPFRYAGFSFAR
jgi:menaquinone-dependent protoporphyrinogen IX oxidase